MPTSRIVHGNIAAKFQFPWHVSLTISYANSSLRSYCGGSLISTRYVLTAATCLTNAVSIKADFGSISWSKPLQSQTTTKGMIHPQFNPKNNANNIAIIQLDQDVWYTNDKRAILLAGQSQTNNLFVNTTSYISGFGVAQNGNKRNLKMSSHQNVFLIPNCTRRIKLLVGEFAICFHNGHNERSVSTFLPNGTCS